MTPKCETCNERAPVAVVSVPGVPYSAAYCAECLAANAHPWRLLVSNTACCNGLKNMNGEWQVMVRATCAHLGRTLIQFEADVEKDMKTLDEMLP